MTQGHDKMKKQSGNAVVFVLIAVVVVAIGALALMSDKFKVKESASDNQSAKSVVSADGSESTDTNPVIAKVNNMEIYRQDAIDMMNAMPPQLRAIPPEQLLPIAVEQLIANKIVDEKAGSAGLEKDAEVLEQLAMAKEQIIRTKFLENVADEAITEEAVSEAYAEYVANFKSVPEVRAAHILVNDEKTAKEIIAKLAKGGDFAALAAEYSKDGTAQNGGDLGYFAQAAVVPEFGDAAFAMKVGETSKAPVKTDFGYHVIKIEDKRARPAAELAEVQPMLENDIRRKALDAAIISWRDDYKIERFDMKGNPIADAEPASGAAETDEAAVSDEAPAAQEEAPAEEAAQ